MIQLLLPQFTYKTSNNVRLFIVFIQIITVLTTLQFYHNTIFPQPSAILKSIIETVTDIDFFVDFIATFSLVMTSMAIAVLIALVLVYLSLIPVFKNFALFTSKLRFLTYSGLIFVFTVIFKNGHDIKISLLLFGIIPYFVTSFMSYIGDISSQEYQLCYTLKFSKWKTLYEVVILGKLHLVLEVIRQNFAIAWMMITTVEGLSMSEGGLGTLMIKAGKFLRMDDVYAVLFIILIVGILFDWFFDVLKVWIFPYTDTKRNSNLLINKILAHQIKNQN